MQRQDGVPAQEGTGTRSKVSLVRTRANGVADGVRSHQHQPGSDDLVVEDSMTKARQSAGVQALEKSSERRLGQVQRRTITPVRLSVETKQRIEIRVLTVARTVTLAAANQSLEILIDSFPLSRHVRQRNHVRIGQRGLPAPGEKRSQVDQRGMVVQRNVRIAAARQAPLELSEHRLHLRGLVRVKLPRRQIEDDAVVIQEGAIGDNCAGALPALVQRDATDQLIVQEDADDPETRARGFAQRGQILRSPIYATLRRPAKQGTPCIEIRFAKFARAHIRGLLGKTGHGHAARPASRLRSALPRTRAVATIAGMGSSKQPTGCRALATSTTQRHQLVSLAVTSIRMEKKS